MQQFDVYSIPSRTTKEASPYLVDIQNEVIDELATRLVVPLTAVSMNPTTFMTQQLTSIPKEKLKDPVGTLKSARELLIDAIDFAISGI